VSRRYVLIKDHYWDTPLDLAGLCVADYLGNAPYGIPLPYHFLRLEEWVSLFRRHGLRIVSWGAWKLHPLDPCKHIVVKLQKT
jgi:hypothetical protein